MQDIKRDDLIKGSDFNYAPIIKSYSDDDMKIIQINEDGEYTKIILKKYFKPEPITLVIQQYKKNYDQSADLDDIYYELLMNQIISESVLIEKIPFFLLNIGNFNITYDKLSESLQTKVKKYSGSG
jgi:hypothetical protein